MAKCLCRTRFNYFVALPVNTEAIQEAFEDLKSQILGMDKASKAQIDDSTFISAKKLHLTVLMLKLYTDESRSLANQVS